MPHWGFYEWFCILILSGAPAIILIYLAIKATPDVIREIRLLSRVPNPRDNHRDN